MFIGKNVREKLPHEKYKNKKNRRVNLLKIIKDTYEFYAYLWGVRKWLDKKSQGKL